MTPPPSWTNDGRHLLAGDPGAELVVVVVPCPPAHAYLPASACINRYKLGLYQPCGECRLGPERGAPITWKPAKGAPNNGVRRTVAAVEADTPHENGTKGRGPVMGSAFAGRFVLHVREQLGMSRRAFATALRCSPQLIFMLEANAQRLTIKRRSQILALVNARRTRS